MHDVEARVFSSMQATRSAPVWRDVQNLARREDRQLTPDGAEAWPDVQAQLLKVDHGKTIVQVMDGVWIHAIKCLIR